MARTSTVEIVTADGPMALFEASPDVAPDQLAQHPAVIVLQEAFGVNDYVESVAGRLADAGYHAVAPHLFHRSGDPVLAYDDYQAAPRHMAALGDAGILADTDAAVDHLERAGHRPEQVGVVGFCMGGRAAFLVASSRALGAAVTFYGGAIVTPRNEWMPALIDQVPSLATPWLGLFGDEDAGIPVADVERLRAELEAGAPVPWDLVRYPAAGHGFHCDRRDSYAPDAAEDGWRRTLDWFATHLG